MGIFADQLCDEKAQILKDKKEELATRMEILFQAGGMMEFHHIDLYNN